MFKKIFSDAIYYLAGNIAVQVVGLLSVVAAMRVFEVSQFGVYSYAVAFVTFFSFIADGGLSQYVIKEIAQHPDRASEIYRNVQGVQLVLSGIISVLLTTFAWSLHTRDELIIILALGAGAIVTGYVSPIFSTLIAQGQKRLILKKDLFVSGVRLAYIGLFLLSGSLIFFAFSNLVAALAAFAYCMYLQRDPKFSYVFQRYLDWQRFRTIAIQGLPYSALMFANILYNKIDVVMLKYLSGEGEVGLYSGATQFIYPFMFVSTVLATGLFPHLSKNAADHAQFREARNKGAIVMACAGFCLSAFLYLGSDILFGLLFHGKYNLSIPIYKILVWYLFIVFSYGAFSNAVVAKGGVRRILSMTVVMLALNIALNLFTIPAWGATGAALSTLVCEVLILICVIVMSIFPSEVKPFPECQTGPLSTPKDRTESI
jgi:O-antigen/teichoic acid export membrane protein